MPSFNRRGFLQLISAAGVTPLLPSLPTTRVMASTATMSTSKALWAGIYAKSGSAPEFLRVARNMGLSNSAIQGVSARSIGVRVAVSAAANPVSRVTGSTKATTPSHITARAERLKASRNITRDIKRALSIEPDEGKTKVEIDTEALDPSGIHSKPENDAT